MNDLNFVKFTFDMKTIIKNISELVQTESSPRKWVRKRNVQLNTIKDGFFRIFKMVL